MHLLKGSRIAIKAVTAHKLQALLAFLGIVVGVAGGLILSRVTGWPTAISDVRPPGSQSAGPSSRV
jgi:formate-dependent nitrite reductase membrane component NrfD